MAALLMALVLAAVAAGCGSSGGDSSSESSTTTASASGGSSQEGATGSPGGFELSDEARTCLKEQGAELPESGQGGAEGGPPEGGEPPSGGEPPEGGQMPEGEPPSGGDSDQFKEMQQAFEECGVEMNGKPSGTKTDSAASDKQVKEYVACVRENGYDLPEPNLSGEGPIFSSSEVDQSDPKFKKASERCSGRLG